MGLGALALEAGDALGAADIAERILRRIGEAAPIERIPALELLARARAGLGEFDAAGEALAELAGIVERSERRTCGPRPAGRGRGRRASGDHEEARRGLEDALDLFAESAAPYEAALARLALSRTLASLGRADAAGAEAERAREAFARSAPPATRRDPADSARNRAGSASSPLASARCSRSSPRG